MRAFYGAIDKIRANDQDVSFFFLTDSTGEAYSEWVGYFTDNLAAAFPTHTIQYEEYWNSGGEDWGLSDTVQTGTGSYTVTVWNAGGAGYDASTFTAAELAIIQNPTAVDYIVVALGHNGNTVSEWNALIDMLQDNWQRAYINISTQNPPTSAAPYTGSYWDSTTVAAARRYGLPWIDVEGAFVATGDVDSYLGDTVHPNDAGRELWGDYVYSIFQAGSLESSMNIFDEAEVLLRAKNYGGSGDWLDASGNGHNGAITGATYLAYDGEPYFWYPGSADNHISVADSATLDVTTLLDVRVKCSMDDWDAAGTYALAQHGGFNSSGWLFANVNGNLTLYGMTGAGNNSEFMDKADWVTNGLVTDGEPKWLRVTMSETGGSGGVYQTTFYVSDDGETWTQAEQKDGAGAHTFIAGASNLVIGHRSDDAWAWPGNIYRFELYDDSTQILDIRAADAAEPFSTFTERINGLTVTINVSGTSYRVTKVDRAMFVFSTDDLITITDDDGLDFSATQDLTLLVAHRMDARQVGSFTTVIANKALDASAGYGIFFDNSNDSRAYIADGTNAPYRAQPFDDLGNVAVVSALRRKVADDELKAYTDGSSFEGGGTDTTTGSLASSNDLLIGAWPPFAYYYQGQVSDVVLFRKALSDAEVRIAGLMLLADADDPRELHGEALQAWIEANDDASYSSLALVGILNEINNTNGVEYAQARGTYLGVEPAG